MNFFTSLVAGIVVAWLASLLMETDGREEFQRNIIAGICGAFVGSWILGTLVEPGFPGQFSFSILAASISGSSIALYAMNRVSRA